MELSFDLDAKDYMAGAYEIVRRRHRRSRLPLIIGIPLGALIGWLSPVLSRREAVLGLCLLLVVYFTATYMWNLARSRRNLLPTRPGFAIGHRQLILGADGLIEKGPGFTLQIDWAAVQGVKVDGAYVFIHVDDVANVVIPKRSLGTTLTAEELAAEVQKHIDASRTHVTDSPPDTHS